MYDTTHIVVIDYVYVSSSWRWNFEDIY